MLLGRIEETDLLSTVQIVFKEKTSLLVTRSETRKGILKPNTTASK
jgi:hypothetical protein